MLSFLYIWNGSNPKRISRAGHLRAVSLSFSIRLDPLPGKENDMLRFLAVEWVTGESLTGHWFLGKVCGLEITNLYRQERSLNGSNHPENKPIC